MKASSIKRKHTTVDVCDVGNTSKYCLFHIVFTWQQRNESKRSILNNSYLHNIIKSKSYFISMLNNCNRSWWLLCIGHKNFCRYYYLSLTFISLKKTYSICLIVIAKDRHPQMSWFVVRCRSFKRGISADEIVRISFYMYIMWWKYKRLLTSVHPCSSNNSWSWIDIKYSTCLGKLNSIVIHKKGGRCCWVITYF